MEIDRLREIIKHTKKLNVLYVEDNLEVQQQTTKMLESFFKNICVAPNGKVALVNSTTPLTGGCPTDASIIDFVGFGSANCFEGSGATSVLSNTTAAIRNNNGCDDTDVNSADFTVATHSAALNCCGLKNCCNRLYSFTWILRVCITHSPAPSILDGPQLINMPNLSFLNSVRAFTFDADGV